jgi:pimeloyl-ACP methyl ester carboxylesterase
MSYLKVEGRKAHVVQRQPVPVASPPIVFVHGAGGTHQHWLYQVRDLPHVPSYALDLPGHGQSEGLGRDSVGAYADWLIAFLDAARLGQAILVGHSMGGAIALHVALQHPGRVAGLGLVATGARLRVAPALLEAIRQDFQAAVALMGDWVFGPEAPQEMVRQGQRQLTATAPEVLYGDLVACDAFNVLDRLGEITVPTLILCGTQDRMTPMKYSTYLRDHIRGAKLHLVEGAGHMLMIENPGAVAQALASFALPAERAQGET